MKKTLVLVLAIVLPIFCSGCDSSNGAETKTLTGADPGVKIEQLLAEAKQDPKPFVIVGEGEELGQGVVITEDGFVLSAAHVIYDRKTDAYPEEKTVSFRKDVANPWPGAVSSHQTTFVDVGHRSYFEESYTAKTIINADNKPIINHNDLGLLKIQTTAKLPHVALYSKTMPKIELGDKLYMAQYCYPTHSGDPTLLVTPLEVIGAVQSTAGVQYLAQGFFRWGSSGAAILKDGKVIGIQSNGYAVNSPGGETQLGHLSFAPICEDLVNPLIEKTRAAANQK